MYLISYFGMLASNNIDESLISIVSVMFYLMAIHIYSKVSCVMFIYSITLSNMHVLQELNIFGVIQLLVNISVVSG